jgi:hypothetical protein
MVHLNRKLNTTTIPSFSFVCNYATECVLTETSATNTETAEILKVEEPVLQTAKCTVCSSV